MASGMEGLIKISSIEQVVALISTHLFYLKLLSESEGGSQQFTQLETAAQAVSKAAKNMAAVASRVMAGSEDDVMKMEMSPLLEHLMMSGQHVLLATQKLSIEPEVTEHREELTEATQNVLLGVVKILLVEDDATVRKITAAAQWLLECLTEVGAATDMPSLLNAFQVYSKAMLLLHSLVVERLQDLCDCRKQELVKGSMETLRRCISMLHTAMYATIKHPSSEEAQDAKKYILHHVDTTVNNIIIMLKANCQPVSMDSCGYYTERRTRLLRLLSNQEYILLKDKVFDILLRDLVFHSMAVANSSRTIIRTCVTANCKLVLQLWSEISQQIKSPLDKQKGKEHLDNLRGSLIKQIHKLDDAVVTASLYQIMDIFTITSGPLEQLVNTAHYMSTSEPDGDLELDPLQPLSEAFIAHADRMTAVASFIAALANNKKSLESVEDSRTCLMHLKDGVAQLLLELRGNSVQYQGALHKLINVQQKWVEEKEQLLNAFGNVINMKDYIQLAVQEMKSDFHKCVEAHREQDCHLFGKHMSCLIGRMNQVIQLVKGHVDKNDDPIYRNGLLVLVKQAEGSIAEVAACTFNTFLAEGEFSLLTDRVSVAIKNVEVLCDGLDGLQHPHLLSPLRKEARHSDVCPPVPAIAEPQKPTKKQAKSEDIFLGEETNNLATELINDLSYKEKLEPITMLQAENMEVKKPTFMVESKLFTTQQNIDLLPLLCEVVCMTKGKDIEALNSACAGVLELSSCYVQAAKDAASVVDEANKHEMESLRSELVALTPLLVQTAQEQAMSSGKRPDIVFRHSSQFSDLIKNTRKILLPLTGMWYHAIQAIILSHTPNMVDSCIQELNEVMCLCADTVQLVISTDIKVTGEGNESITSVLNKLKKAQTNTKNLTDLLSSKQAQPDELDGLCILWALSIQVLINSLDKVLGIGTTHVSEQIQSRHQMTPKKWLAAMSENSLRIQEAARLSSLNCRDSYKVKLKELQDGVKTLTEVYLKTAEELGTVSRSGVLMLARTELLQRQLQVKMRALSCALSKVNEEYARSLQNIVTLACSVTIREDSIETENTRTQFEATAELLLENIKTATQSVAYCFNFIRDPRERANLKFINDHLLFQMSEIVSRARLMVETQTIFETFSLNIQTQCWSAKAHYLVAELFKVDGILHVTKEQIKLGLQGKVPSGVLETDVTDIISISKETTLHRHVILQHANPVNIFHVNKQEPKLELLSERKSDELPVFDFADTTLAYTSLFLKQEAERWDIHGNQIVKVTKEMADKIYQMTQYLKRKGPIQSKDAFVTSAKDLVSSCQSITEFLRVIADHCLDKHCTKELSIMREQIVTITNQLVIISGVNAVTPGCKSSDEILVKNAQNLLKTVIQGMRSAETACIKGLRQPEPNSDAAKAASLCFQWRKKLLIHRAQEQLNPETDDLGLRKTSVHGPTPSLVPPITELKKHK